MKSYKNIYPQICDYHNLYESWRKAARGKRKVPEVADFEYYLLENLFQLEEKLLTETYRPGPSRHFYITEPKLRRIGSKTTSLKPCRATSRRSRSRHAPDSRSMPW